MVIMKFAVVQCLWYHLPRKQSLQQDIVLTFCIRDHHHQVYGTRHHELAAIDIQGLARRGSESTYGTWA